MIRIYNDLLALPNGPSALATRLLELTDEESLVLAEAAIAWLEGDEINGENMLDFDYSNSPKSWVCHLGQSCFHLTVSKK